MAIDVQVPRLAESISEAVLVEWLKEDGAAVRVDEPIATLETDKAAVEIAAPESGVLRHARKPGDHVVVGDVIARVEPGGAAVAVPSAGEPAAAKAGAEASKPAGTTASKPGKVAVASPGRPETGTSFPRESRAVPTGDGERAVSPATARASSTAPARTEPHLSPAVRRLVEEQGLEPSAIEPTGRGGRLLKEDVLRHLERREDQAGTAAPAPPAAREAPAPAGTLSAAPPAARQAPLPPPAPSAAAPVPAGEDEHAVPMSRIRLRIAEKLVLAQSTAAILTTFNEIDMTAVLQVRERHREGFERRHGVRLGFMSFFTRASGIALHEIPELNAEIRGTDIVYKRRVHMGIAVSTERGLVVPVVRDADRLGFAEIEREIARLAERAREGTLKLHELSGGTFTISNGGVYGSLFSTPILNPPQSGILGMHKIEKRPVAVGDQVVVRPMMYVALSYDHRIVDGEQAVTFLVRVKELLEDPERMLLDV